MKTLLDRLGCLMLLPWMLLPVRAEEPAVVPPLNRFPRMVHEYFVDRVRAIDQRRTERLAAIDTLEEALAYRQQVRDKIRQSFGPLPERTPLNARVTGVIERDGYRVEKVIFQSRPGMFVTGNLYLPRNATGPLPAVVGSCGHSNNGKCEAAYQAFCQGLVQQGYVVLIYDPIGQGERLQYVDEAFQPRRGIGVSEHLYIGGQQTLVGEFFGTWRAWDGIRALDYLLSRSEVDPQRIGVTGNSGGGTLTTWLCGLDDRWAMAAPSCFVTSFRRNLENELPADSEQCPPRALEFELDHEDFLLALAPKPIIVLTKERDYFDVRGSEAAFGRLQQFYRALQAPDQIALFTGPGPHGYSQENREAMYRWFHRATGKPLDANEPPVQAEPDETLWCAPHGQVAALQSRTVFEFTRERAMALQSQRGNPTGAALEAALRRTLQLDVPDAPPEYRILRPRAARGYPLPRFTTYLVETDPGVQAVVYRLSRESVMSRPRGDGQPVLLYVSDRSSDVELREDAWLAELINADSQLACFTCDVRGAGESQPDTCDADSYLEPYGSDYFYATHSLMLGDPYPGQKARDVMRVVRWLHECGYGPIHLVTQGRGTVPAAIAALLCDDVQQVTLRHALNSYHELAANESYAWPLSCLIPNVLAHFDLPDVYRELEKRKQAFRIVK
jgi:cephalosporin-C deacetylase-like acetyl esterase